MLATCWTRAAMAQSTARVVGDDVKHAAGDAWYVWTSPFHADGRSWAQAAVAATAVLGAATVDRRVDHWVATHPSSVPLRAISPWRETKHGPFRNVGLGKVLLPISGALYAAGLIAHASGHEGTGRDFRDAAIGCAVTQQSIAAVRYGIYAVLARPRPYVANGHPFDFKLQRTDWETQSFIAGHVANSMGCATFFNRRFDHLGPASPLLYVFPVGTALARIGDRRHWTSDVVLGAILGYAVGNTLALRSKARR